MKHSLLIASLLLLAVACKKKDAHKFSVAYSAKHNADSVTIWYVDGDIKNRMVSPAPKSFAYSYTCDTLVKPGGFIAIWGEIHNPKPTDSLTCTLIIDGRIIDSETMNQYAAASNNP